MHSNEIHQYYCQAYWYRRKDSTSGDLQYHITSLLFLLENQKELYLGMGEC